MSSFTRFFLVLLRLAIGWHFLIEGVEKIHSVQLGPTESNRPWTSEPYLREASGPLAPYFRQQFGDPDAEAIALLQVAPQTDNKQPLRTRLAPALDAAWNTYYGRFADHYQLSGEQRTLAEAKLDQAKENAAAWLLGMRGAQDVKHAFPSGSVDVKRTPAERVREYVEKVEQLRDHENNRLPDFGRDVLKQKLRADKAEVALLRTDLLNDLNKPMREALDSVLTDEQKKQTSAATAKTHWLAWTDEEWGIALVGWGLLAVGAVLLLSQLGLIAGVHARDLGRLGWLEWCLLTVLFLGAVFGVTVSLAWGVREAQDWDLATRINSSLTWAAAALGVFFLVSALAQIAGRTRGVAAWGWGRWFLAWLLAFAGAIVCLGLAYHFALQRWADWTQQEWLDWLVAFGLTAVGVGLLLGFLTRPACLGGALLLLMFYLTMPPFPGVPDNPKAEGHYLFVNKNLIEMLALLALATTRSGRWLGLDGLFSVLNPVRWFVSTPTPNNPRVARTDQ